jgi:uncharacterized membrane protein (UPF0127 family)
VIASVRESGRHSYRLAVLERRFVLIALFVISLCAAPAEAFQKSSLEIMTKAGPHRFNIELAVSMAEQEQGLQFRKELASDYGMLFDFGDEEKVSFWMKNTYVPLDIIFIRGDGTIARIAENAVPLSLDSLPSGEPVRAVLEVIGGTSKRLGIAPGDRVVHPIFSRK